MVRVAKNPDAVHAIAPVQQQDEPAGKRPCLVSGAWRSAAHSSTPQPSVSWALIPEPVLLTDNIDDVPNIMSSKEMQQTPNNHVDFGHGMAGFTSDAGRPGSQATRGWRSAASAKLNCATDQQQCVVPAQLNFVALAHTPVTRYSNAQSHAVPSPESVGNFPHDAAASAGANAPSGPAGAGQCAPTTAANTAEALPPLKPGGWHEAHRAAPPAVPAVWAPLSPAVQGTRLDMDACVSSDSGSPQHPAEAPSQQSSEHVAAEQATDGSRPNMTMPAAAGMAIHEPSLLTSPSMSTPLAWQASWQASLRSTPATGARSPHSSQRAGRMGAPNSTGSRGAPGSDMAPRTKRARSAGAGRGTGRALPHPAQTPTSAGAPVPTAHAGLFTPTAPVQHGQGLSIQVPPWPSAMHTQVQGQGAGSFPHGCSPGWQSEVGSCHGSGPAGAAAGYHSDGELTSPGSCTYASPPGAGHLGRGRLTVSPTTAASWRGGNPMPKQASAASAGATQLTSPSQAAEGGVCFENPVFKNMR
jgi:hypothetical protein